jgi:glutamine amidotransferase
MIKIIDYGFGNIGSLVNAFKRIVNDVSVVYSLRDVTDEDILVLPGVGAFDNAVERLKELDILSALKERVCQGGATIGICLGAQLLCSKSEEGEKQGIGAFNVEVIGFDSASQSPNMGWRTVRDNKDNDLGVFYFTHSYYFSRETKPELVYATSKNNEVFPVVLRNKSVWAIQFHPEKSQDNGIKFLEYVLSEIT